MKKLLALLTFLGCLSAAIADPLSPWMGSFTNSSTITLTSRTTARSAGTLMANNATAASITNQLFKIAKGYQGAFIPRLRLSINDATSTAWNGQTIQIDLWSCAPTWTNADAGTWLPATGSACHLGAFTCVMPSAEWGDGIATECSPNVSNFAMPNIADNVLEVPPRAGIYWSLQAVTGSGVTGASAVVTMTPEFLF